MGSSPTTGTIKVAAFVYQDKGGYFVLYCILSAVVVKYYVKNRFLGNEAENGNQKV